MYIPLHWEGVGINTQSNNQNFVQHGYLLLMQGYISRKCLMVYSKFTEVLCETKDQFKVRIVSCEIFCPYSWATRVQRDIAIKIIFVTDQRKSKLSIAIRILSDRITLLMCKLNLGS